MAKSINCLKCKYSGYLYGQPTNDWKNGVTCEYILIKHERGDKGDDPDNCKLFEQRTRSGSKERLY